MAGWICWSEALGRWRRTGAGRVIAWLLHSKRGRELIEHEKRGLSVHLFVREDRKQAGKAAPFTYHGPVRYRRHSGSAPMSVVFELLN